MRNKIWIIEWSIINHTYLIKRYAEPTILVGTDYYIDDCIKDINGNYPEWEVILIRDQAGCVSYKLNEENSHIL